MITWWQPQIGQEERTLLNQVLDSNFLNDGPLTERFEQRLQALLGCKYAVAVTSGTAALFLALKALGISKGDEVIVPDITFIATANAVEMTGAKPVLVDVSHETLTMSPEALSNAITDKTQAIIPVHVSGRACDMRPILRIAQENDITIVEDAAEALMSKHDDKYLGTIGDLGCFSFSPNKTIQSGQGGLVVTNNTYLYEQLRLLKDQGRPKRGTGGDDIHYSVGYNFKWTDLQAAVGLGQLSYLHQRTTRMQEIHKLYIDLLSTIPELTLLPFSNEEVPQWTDAIVTDRNGLVSHLAAKNISTRNFWFPIHTQIPYKQPNINFRVSTDLSSKALWLPSAFTLSDSDVETVCKEIKEFYATLK